jgi:hypothetical protein
LVVTSDSSAVNYVADRHRLGLDPDLSIPGAACRHGGAASGLDSRARDDPRCDSPTKFEAGPRVARIDGARNDATPCGLVGGRRQAFRVRWKQMREHRGGGAGGNRALTRIRRAGRDRHLRYERSVELDRTQAPVGVLGVPGGDQGVVDRNVEQRERANSGGGAQAITGNHGYEQLVPAMSRRSEIPVPDAVERGRVFTDDESAQLPPLA